MNSELIEWVVEEYIDWLEDMGYSQEYIDEEYNSVITFMGEQEDD